VFHAKAQSSALGGGVANPRRGLDIENKTVRKMTVKARIALLIGVLALLAAPTAALGHGVEYETEAPPKHKGPGPAATPAAKARAYGVYCAAFPKKPVAGTPGTPFSSCVNAMAKAATTKKTARQVCATFPKTHEAGRKGTPFSRCVVAAAKVKQRSA
jgi:hypothetical protein